MALDEFDTLEDGRVVHRLVLGAAPGVVLHVLTLGATVHRLELTGGDGVRRDVALGHRDAASYRAADDYRGATVGRYANRIDHGRFGLDGRVVQLGTHDGGHHLHGGPDGFDRRLWTVVEHGEEHAVLRLVSPDGDQGFPGTLTAEARFDVRRDRVGITLTATTDATTVVNLTNHAYLNLDGVGSGRIDDHGLVVNADSYLPVDDGGIPLGGPTPVEGTAFDLRTATPIGARVIDHAYEVRGAELRAAAVLTSARTRTRAELWTDQPGLQVFTADTVDEPRTGLALEPQLFPDTPNHPGWPSARLEPGGTYRSEIVWEFGRIS